MTGLTGYGPTTLSCIYKAILSNELNIYELLLRHSFVVRTTVALG